MIDRKHIMIAALLLSVGLFSCGGETGQQAANEGGQRQGRPRAAASPVKVEPVKKSDISQYILKNTTLEAEQWVEIRARTSGQVIEIIKEEGDPVQAGSVIARLDDDVARINVSQREVAYREAQQRYEREEALFKRNLGSKEGYASAQTQLEAGKALLEQAQLTLGYTSIESPIAGILTTRSIEVGNMVTNNQVVAAVANFNPLLARIQVTEKDFGKINVGQSARITVEAAPNKEFRGRVRMISPVVDPESGTVKVTVEIPRSNNDLLRPGMFASVYIITETRQNALVISKKGLVLEGEGNQVFVYEKDEETGMGKAQRKRIEIGFTDSDRLEVLSGLSEGEQVITVGQEGLRPGSAVRLVGEGAPTLATAPGGAPEGQPGARPSRGGPSEGGAPKSGTPAGGSPAAGSPAGGASGGALSAGGMPGGGPPGGGGDDAERLKRMIGMIERTPEVKKIYDERVKQDPELPKSMDKVRAFMGEMREKGLIQGRGRQGN